VDDDFGILHELAQFRGDFVELRLVAQEFGGQAVDRQRRLVRVALGIDIAVEVVAGQLAVEDFNAADFDDAVARAWIQAGGFGVEERFVAYAYFTRFNA
jgi:hypothetical protein